MKQLKMLSAMGMLAVAGMANAGVTSTITATNDYDFRGTTQTDEDPALQASLDFAHDSGWYIGAWASNVDFPGYDGNMELDLYTGFTGSVSDDLTWDAGVVMYMYPGSDVTATESEIQQFPEIYGSLAYKMVKGKLSYSNDFAGTDEDGIYVDLSLNVPLPNNFSLQAHVGQSSGDGVDIAWGDSYVDYSAGVGYTAGNFNLSLKWVDTDIDGRDDGRFIFSVASTLPWK